MKKANKKTETRKVGKFIYWTPRIVSIIFILFLMLFSFDVFGNGYGFWGTLLAFLIHNIPVFILTAILVISWRYEVVGGIVFILAGLFYIFMLLMSKNFEWYMMFWSVTISGPAFFIGILFLINWRRRRRRKGAEE
ncbi:MAG: DUF7670 domain-containing protein [Candidatus Woesearchaeota archaeon]